MISSTYRINVPTHRIASNHQFNAPLLRISFTDLFNGSLRRITWMYQINAYQPVEARRTHHQATDQTIGHEQNTSESSAVRTESDSPSNLIHQTQNTGYEKQTPSPHPRLVGRDQIRQPSYQPVRRTFNPPFGRSNRETNRTNRFTDLSTNGLINHSTDQPISRSITQPIDRPFNQPAIRSLNQSISSSRIQPSTHPRVDQPFNQPTSRPTIRRTDQPIDPSTNRFVDLWAIPCVDQSAHRSFNHFSRSINQSNSVDPSINQSAEQPVDQAFDQTTTRLKSMRMGVEPFLSNHCINHRVSTLEGRLPKRGTTRYQPLSHRLCLLQSTNFL